MTMPMSVTAERTQWATRIWAVWQKSVDNIIETGRLLHAAKADPKMQHGEWGTMVESDLPFNRHTAYKLMQIAGDKRLTNVSPGKHLPPSWTTLYELTKLDDDTLNRKLRDGTIHPGMQRKDVARENRTKMSAGTGKAQSKPPAQKSRSSADVGPASMVNIDSSGARGLRHGSRTERDRRCLQRDRVGFHIDAGFKHTEPSMERGNRIRPPSILQ
jgi:hypothetical protein